MTDSIADKKEFSEKTVDKAIEAACKYFGCEKDELKVDIITRGSTGLFGLGGRKAKIKAKPAGDFSAPLQDEKEEEPVSTETGRESGNAPAFEEKRQTAPGDKSGEVQGARPSRQVAKREKNRRQTGAKTSQRSPKREEIAPEELERHLAIASDLTNKLLEKAGLAGKAHVVEQATKSYINITILEIQR